MSKKRRVLGFLWKASKLLIIPLIIDEIRKRKPKVAALLDIIADEIIVTVKSENPTAKKNKLLTKANSRVRDKKLGGKETDALYELVRMRLEEE